jgi:hypothetical protein
MNQLKFKIFGAQAKFQSGPLIKEELESRGHKIINLPSEKPDILIHLTGLFHEAEEFYSLCNPKPVRIYCLLDIDPFKPDFQSFYKDVPKHLSECEIPCVISDFVKTDVELKFGVKNLNIWHYPIRPVSYLNVEKDIEYLYSGRLYSQNKRFYLVRDVLDCLNFNKSKLVTVGPENPGFGIWVKDVSDYDLNIYFNRAKYLLSPSSIEGLNLNLIQAIITHTIPITCEDCEVVKEWSLEMFSSPPNPEKIKEKILDINADYSYYLSVIKEIAPDFERKFKVNGVVDKLEELIKSHRQNE